MLLGTVGVLFLERNTLREELHPVVKAALAIAGAAILLLGLAGGIYFLNNSPAPLPPVPVLKQLDREVIRGARVFDPQKGTLPVVRFDSVRITKPRFGGISLGGFNRLEIDGLKLIVYANSGAEADLTNSDNDFSPSAALRAGNLRELLNPEELIRKSGIFQRVSSVRINSLQISVFANKELTEILFAKSAKSVQSGHLLLEECGFLDETLVLHQVSSAELDVERGILTADDFQINLRTVTDALGSKSAVHLQGGDR